MPFLPKIAAMSLAPRFAAYAEWRSQLAARIGALQDWLVRNELAGAQTALRFALLQDKLRDDKLTVAFVAEFSRGKSELINAMFFSTYGNRILPSSAGRTTMCPTELYWEEGKPARIELLPITTRASNRGVSEFRNQPEAWTQVLLDTASAAAMQAALRHVSETLRVAPEEAAALGFAVGEEASDLYRVAADGLVEVPRWRHALINFPHPLLQQGLVILDTPGLNAVGAEPELTLSLLPNAHAVLFLLAADTGVSQSDLTIWKEYIGGAGLPRAGRLVVLNKIDGQWDELKSATEVDSEIARQAASCASVLGLAPGLVYPVSAQKALVARVNGDARLLERSRLPLLEEALSQALIPARRQIVGERIASEFGAAISGIRTLQESRLAGLRGQLVELVGLRGKNQGVVEYLMGQISSEKAGFEAGLQRYYAVRNVFNAHSSKLFSHLSSDSLRQLTRDTRSTMLEANFSSVLSEAMNAFFARSREMLTAAGGEIDEILEMMDAVYQRFTSEHGLKLGTPTAFSLSRYGAEIDRLQTWCDTHLNTMLTLLTRDKKNITQKFFEEVAIQIRRAFEQANKDVEIWLRAIMAPVETQVREHQLQLKRRLDSLRRIHQASDSLEERIAEFEATENTLSRQIETLEGLAGEIDKLLRPA